MHRSVSLHTTPHLPSASLCRVTPPTVRNARVHPMCRTVRQIFNLYPRKGRLAAGSDADVVLFDPRVGHTLGVGTHHSRMDTNIYEGKAVQVGGGAAGCLLRTYGACVWNKFCKAQASRRGHVALTVCWLRGVPKVQCRLPGLVGSKRNDAGWLLESGSGAALMQSGRPPSKLPNVATTSQLRHVC